MDKYILANITNLSLRKRAMECRFGLMVQNMKDFGKMTWLLDMVDLYWPTEMYIRVNGLRTKPMDKANITMPRVQPIAVVGSKISKRVQVVKNGQTEVIMKAST